MDIIRNLNIVWEEECKEEENKEEELPEIIPKSIQMRMKEQLGPILTQKYEEDAAKRQQLIQNMQSILDFGNSMAY
jgi:hypothetical protein